MTEYYEEELKQIMDKFDNEIVKGCPNCKTDAYLMDADKVYLVVNELNDWIGVFDLSKQSLKECLIDEGVYSEDVEYYAYQVKNELPDKTLKITEL